ncbi:MAG: hypothetical protein LIO51_03750 [Clostridiales bacterium]|nr:hypothetical protein [Clostridiales bacterium]
MKPSKYIFRILMLVLLAGALAYFGVYAYQVFVGGYETATVYSYTSQSTLSSSGYVVREETVLEDGGDLMEIVVGEGENVAVGGVVARIYSTQEALEQHQELDQLLTELERLEYLQSNGTEESDAMELNSQIVAAITALRSTVSSGDLDDLSDQVLELEELVFRRDYTISSDSSLTEEIAELKSQIYALENATESATSTVRTSVSGVFSALVDGYEGCLTFDILDDLTPESLRAAAAVQSQVPDQITGKVITSFDWYYAAIMDKSVTKYLATGDTATVNFEGSAGSQRMTVQSISSANENGEVAVVFYSNRNLSSTTLLREQEAEVAYGTYTGLRVPLKALRIDQETGAYGVYRITGGQAKWVEVELLYTGSDYYLVQSVTEENMTQTQEAKQLRAGDRVLVSGKDLHDGKVVIDDE